MFRKILLVISVSLFFAVAICGQGTSMTPSTADSTAKKPAVFRPTKDQIKQGQAILKDKKYYDGEASGVYNDTTRAAIKKFQKENGLEINGKFDKVTLEKMGVSTDPKTMTSTTKPSTAEKPTAASSTAKRPPPFSANKDQIIALQKVLKDSKMFTGEANGERSDALKEAVKAYQKANGLKETGGINAATLDKMGIALTDDQKANVAAQAAYDAAKPKN